MFTPQHDHLFSRRDLLKLASPSAAGFSLGNQCVGLASAAEQRRKALQTRQGAETHVEEVRGVSLAALVVRARCAGEVRFARLLSRPGGQEAPANRTAGRSRRERLIHSLRYRLLPLTLAFALSGALHAQTVTIAPSYKGLRIDIDGALFTEYVTKDITNPCFNPVIGPGGVSVTREYPPVPGVKVDHPHHRGIWIGHDGVNGVNFWATDAGMSRVENTGFAEVQAEGNRASFTATSNWLNPAGELVLTDRRDIVITALPEGTRQLDLAVTFLATAGEVTFRDTKEGTVGIRVAPSLTLAGNKYQAIAGRGHILTSAGVVDTKAWGTRGNWVAYFGPDPKGDPVTITMMDHPGNLRHPTWWHVRNYGLFAANPFGQTDFEAPPKASKGKEVAPAVARARSHYVLANGQSLTQRYRFLFQKGEPDAAKLNAIFTEFSATR